MSPKRKGYVPGHISIISFDPTSPSQLRAFDRMLIERGLEKGYAIEEILLPEELELPDEDNMDGEVDG